MLIKEESDPMIAWKAASPGVCQKKSEDRVIFSGNWSQQGKHHQKVVQ